MPKYSVIIPVYNAEKTLRRCVDSLLNQDYSDMELILVNDGSSDDSGAICEKYSARNDCVTYISKPNGGVSTARNAGLDVATGEYVLFVDSDDYVSESYFRILDQLDSDLRYDLLMYSYAVTDGKSVHRKVVEFFAAGCAEECVPMFCRMIYTKSINHPVTKRYVRQIIEENRIRFQENLYVGEDKTFNLQYVMHCSSCLISPEVLYYVSTENALSLSRKPRPDLYEQLEMLSARTRQTIAEADIPEHYRAQYDAAENLIQLRAVYSEAKRMHLAGRDGKFRRETIRRMCRYINEQKAGLPGGMFSRLLQIPVRLRLTTAIDLMGWYLAR